MSDTASAYVTGTPHGNTLPYATFEFKAGHLGSGGRGGGYARWRSVERGPHSPDDSARGVSVAVHRLCAVAWLFPDDWDAADILDSGALVGADVHHELDMPSANLESELSLVSHGRHAEITQSQLRACGEDAKRAASVDDRRDESDTCDRCGEESATFCESVAWDGRYCPTSAKQCSDGERIEVV